MWHDVKALNASASGLVALSVLACAVAGVWWVANRPVFDLRAIRVETMDKSEFKHVNHLTLRNGTQGRLLGNFFTADLAGAQGVRVGAVGTPRQRAARVAEPADRVAGRA